MIILKRLRGACWLKCWRGRVNGAAGFTAVELMVVIAIVAILAALAAPSFRPLIERWRVRDAREAMNASLFLVRSEAIKRGGRVVLQKNPLGADCPQASTTQEWSCGWVVYFDANGNSAMDAGEQIQSFPAPRRLNIMAKSSPSGAERYVFDRWGQSGLSAMGFTISPEPPGVSSPETTTLCITSGGRIRYSPGDATC